MSNPFDKLVHGVEDAAHKIKHGVEQLGHQADHAADKLDPSKVLRQVEREIEGIVHQAEAGVKKGVATARRDIEHLVHDTEAGIKSTARGVQHATIDEIEKYGKIAERKAEQLLDEIEDKAKEIAAKAVDELARGFSRAGLALARDVIHGAHDLFQNFEKHIDGKRLDALRAAGVPVPDVSALVQRIDQTGFKLPIGPVTNRYSGIVTRLGTLVSVADEAVRSPPKFSRHQIIRTTLAFLPDVTEIGGSVYPAALVVAVKELGGGAYLTEIHPEMFAPLADFIMERLGIPA